MGDETRHLLQTDIVDSNKKRNFSPSGLDDSIFNVLSDTSKKCSVGFVQVAELQDQLG